MDRVGVAYEEAQMAYRATVEIAGALIYEDYFAFEEAAALVRELVIITRALDAQRNFDELTLAQVCRELHRALEERHLLEVPGAMDWLALVPLSKERFLALR